MNKRQKQLLQIQQGARALAKVGGTAKEFAERLQEAKDRGLKIKVYHVKGSN